MTDPSPSTTEQPDPDQEICLCFRVTRRKIENFIRITRPRRAAQLSECFGAGTGCGWCRRYLVALFEATRHSGQPPAAIPPADEVRQQRQAYHRQIGYRDHEPGPGGPAGDARDGTGGGAP